MLALVEAPVTAFGNWMVSSGALYLGNAHPNFVFLDPNGEPTKPDLNIVDVNLNGTFYTWKLAVHYFRKQPETEDRDRCFIITGSMVAWIDSPVSICFNVQHTKSVSYTKTGQLGIYRDKVRLAWLHANSTTIQLRTRHTHQLRCSVLDQKCDTFGRV
jgi:hypothetical protein